MRLLVILISLFFERFLSHKIADKRGVWIPWLQTHLLTFCGNHKLLKSNLMKTIVMILPPWLVMAGVYWIVYEDFWGIACFIVNIIIFYFCIGPMNIFYPTEKEGQGIKHLIVINNALFAPIFWYLLLGPLGVLAYRLIDFSGKHVEAELFSKTVIHWLDWIPARITALCYLFIGHFQKGLEPYGAYFLTVPTKNDEMLEKCGVASFAPQDEKISEIAAEKAIEQSLVLYLVFIAIIIIAAWF